MARLPLGKRTLVKTLKSIMESPDTSWDQKLKACEIHEKLLAGMGRQKRAKPEKGKKKSSLLG